MDLSVAGPFQATGPEELANGGEKDLVNLIAIDKREQGLS